MMLFDAISKAYKKIMARIYILNLKMRGASIEGAILCAPPFLYGNFTGFHLSPYACFEAYSKVNIGTINNKPGNLHIGARFYLNSFSIIDCHHQITIGDRVQIGPNCYISDFDYGLKVDLSLPYHRGEKTTAPVKIGDNVWIGAGVTILKGVTIGANTVIGAGSVVKNDIPSNCVAAGVPAKIIKYI